MLSPHIPNFWKTMKMKDPEEKNQFFLSCSVSTRCKFSIMIHFHNNKKNAFSFYKIRKLQKLWRIKFKLSIIPQFIHLLIRVTHIQNCTPYYVQSTLQGSPSRNVNFQLLSFQPFSQYTFDNKIGIRLYTVLDSLFHLTQHKHLPNYQIIFKTMILTAA